VPLIRRVLSSGSTFVEPFHDGFWDPLLLSTEPHSAFISVLGEDWGVRLWLCRCVGRSGVTGEGATLPARIEECKLVLWLFLLFGGGSEDGVRDILPLLTVRGVVDVRPLLVSLRNIRMGDMAPEMMPLALGVLVIR
jgi:hypothetical protein